MPWHLVLFSFHALVWLIWGRLSLSLQGFLLNFCNDNAEATERCGELGFVGVVAANVLSTRTNDAVFNATLNLLVAVAEAPESAGRDGGSFVGEVGFP